MALSHVAQQQKTRSAAGDAIRRCDLILRPTHGRGGSAGFEASRQRTVGHVDVKEVGRLELNTLCHPIKVQRAKHGGVEPSAKLVQRVGVRCARSGDFAGVLAAIVQPEKREKD